MKTTPKRPPSYSTNTQEVCSLPPAPPSFSRPVLTSLRQCSSPWWMANQAPCSRMPRSAHAVRTKGKVPRLAMLVSMPSSSSAYLLLEHHRVEKTRRKITARNVTVGKHRAIPEVARLVATEFYYPRCHKAQLDSLRVPGSRREDFFPACAQ